MKKVKLTLAISLVFILVLTSIIFSNFASAQAGQASLQGRLYGVIVIPSEEMSQLPEEVKNQTFGGETITDLADGSREVKVGIRGWQVSIGKRKVTTNADGGFVLSNLPSGEMNLRVSFKDLSASEQKIVLSPGENKSQDIIIKRSLNQVLQNMGNGTTESGEVGSLSHLPCLDNNYWCRYFVGSDCYKNLVRGNPYCWAEAIMDHPSARWCNGRRNCSVFIGHPQTWHCDYIP